MVYVFFAKGFEEVEALATVDVLRRAGIPTHMVGVDGEVVEGSHGIKVTMDCRVEDIKMDETVQMVVLPGGVPGIHNLKASKKLEHLIREAESTNRFIGAICAAPSILSDWSLLKGRRATVFPTFIDQLVDAHVINESVVHDGTLITGKGVGIVFDFALKLVEVLKSKEESEVLRHNMMMK